MIDKVSSLQKSSKKLNEKLANLKDKLKGNKRDDVGVDSNSRLKSKSFTPLCSSYYQSASLVSLDKEESKQESEKSRRRNTPTAIAPAIASASNQGSHSCELQRLDKIPHSQSLAHSFKLILSLLCVLSISQNECFIVVALEVSQSLSRHFLSLQLPTEMCLTSFNPIQSTPTGSIDIEQHYAMGGAQGA